MIISLFVGNVIWVELVFEILRKVTFSCFINFLELENGGAIKLNSQVTRKRNRNEKSFP